MVELARWYKKYAKNCTLIAWSGGGKPYTEQIVKDLKLEDVFSPSRCFSKIGYQVKADIAYDDIHEFNLADKNVIIRMPIKLIGGSRD